MKFFAQTTTITLLVTSFFLESNSLPIALKELSKRDPTLSESDLEKEGLNKISGTKTKSEEEKESATLQSNTAQVSVSVVSAEDNPASGIKPASAVVENSSDDDSLSGAIKANYKSKFTEHLDDDEETTTTTSGTSSSGASKESAAASSGVITKAQSILKSGKTKLAAGVAIGGGIIAGSAVLGSELVDGSDSSSSNATVSELKESASNSTSAATGTATVDISS